MGSGTESEGGGRRSISKLRGSKKKAGEASRPVALWGVVGCELKKLRRGCERPGKGFSPAGNDRSEMSSSSASLQQGFKGV